MADHPCFPPKFAVFLTTCLFAIPSFGDGVITYHGRLLKSDSTPVTASNVQLRIRIFSPGAEECLLFDETYTRDLSTTGGTFAIRIGMDTPSSANTEPFALERVFQNRSTFTFLGGKCANGATYVPAATDGRKIVLSFNDGSLSDWEDAPEQTIAQVPQAIESFSVGGYESSKLLRVHDPSGAPVSLTPWTQANYAKLENIVAGTDGTYLKTETDPTVPAFLKDGVDWSEVDGKPTTFPAASHTHPIGDVASAPGAYFTYQPNGAACSAGQVLKWTASNRWECGNDDSAGGGGTVTSVTAASGSAVVMSGTATDPTVGVQDASTSVKGVVQLATSAQTAAGLAVQASDTRLSDARMPTAHGHAVNEITSASSAYFTYLPNNVACGDQQTLKWNGPQSRWECGWDLDAGAVSSVSVTAPLKNSGTAGAPNIGMDFAGVMAVNTGLLVRDGSQLHSKVCAADQTLIWTVSNGWSCSAVVLAESDPKIGSNTTDRLSKWNGSALVASAVHEDSGNVGIGTAAPSSTLQVNGSFAIPVTTRTVDYQVGSADNTIFADATSGATTIRLPTAVGAAGRLYTVKKVDASANAVTLATAGSETIDGATTFVLSSRWQYVTVVSDGAGWMTVGSNAAMGGGTNLTFSFNDVTGSNANAVVASSTVTVGGSGGGPVVISGDGSPQMSINGGSWGTGGVVAAGQTLALRLTTGVSASTIHTATIIGGGSTATWNVTTANCVTGSQAFSYTGSVQNFTVPSGCSAIAVKLWGAGGAAGGNGGSGGHGGAGGYVESVISVSGGETLSVEVGGGGKRMDYPSSALSGGWPNGGNSAILAENGGGGAAGGGGSSAVKRGSVALAAAGGGGGGGSGGGIGYSGGAGCSGSGYSANSTKWGGGGTGLVGAGSPGAHRPLSYVAEPGGGGGYPNGGGVGGNYSYGAGGGACLGDASVLGGGKKGGRGNNSSANYEGNGPVASGANGENGEIQISWGP